MPDNIPVKSIGVILKEARSAKNLSLEQASKDTRIHMKILKDIEADNFTAIGPVYARSFLKLYSEYLGINKDEANRCFESAIPSQRQALKIPNPSGDDGFKFSSFLNKIDLRLLIICVAAFFLVFGIVKFVGHRKTVAFASVVKKAQAKKVEVKKASIEVKAEAPKSVSKTIPLKKAKNLPVVKPVVVATTQKAQDLVLTIKAQGKSWLQVKVDGRVVFQGTLAKGSAETWGAKEKIELWLGDAGAVQLEFNGKLLEKIGRPGQTLKRVILDKSGLTVQR